MKLYIDCSMGVAGDMLTAALIELFPDKEKMIAELNALGVPGVQFISEKSVKCGIVGTHMKVLVHGEEEESEDVHVHLHEHEHGHSHEHEHEHGHSYDYEREHNHSHEHDHGHSHEYEHEHDHSHEHDHGHSHEHGHEHDHEYHHHGHHHTSMHDIEHIVNDHLHVSEKVKKDILKVYQSIAEAESVAHGVPVTEIHFHEVGNMDAVADIAAVCYLMDALKPTDVVVSPVHVGSGQVKCAHGILPIPAPATAYLLKDVPSYGGNIKGELCTPTGAALLKHFAASFGSMPLMRTVSIGYGMGKKDFEAANCVRVTLGEEDSVKSDEILELSCNVDDMTGEEIGFAMDRLFEAGARDVFTVGCGMKKNRPGVIICIICTENEKDEIVKAVFKYTTTIGIREARMNRYVLNRRIETVDTEYGPVRCKISSGYGTERRKYEYDDLAGIAKEKNIALSDIQIK